MADKRPLHFCDVCGQLDDHPRHIFVQEPGTSGPTPQVLAFAAGQARASEASDEELATAFAGLNDDTTVYRHMDCCRAAGCPDGTCHQVPADLRGAKLVAHLTGGN